MHSLYFSNSTLSRIQIKRTKGTCVFLDILEAFYAVFVNVAKVEPTLAVRGGLKLLFLFKPLPSHVFSKVY